MSNAVCDRCLNPHESGPKVLFDIDTEDIAYGEIHDIVSRAATLPVEVGAVHRRIVATQHDGHGSRDQTAS